MSNLQLYSWAYHKISLACFSILFIVYCLLLGIPYYIITLFLVFILPSLVKPQKLCRSISIPLLNGLFINYCGFLLPFKAALLILININLDVMYIILILSMSIALASLHTFISNRAIMVNIARYCILLIAISFAVIYENILFYILPFASIIGIVIGSDIMSYIVINFIYKDKKKYMIIGGFMALDSIVLSFILILLMLILLRFIFTIA